METSRQDSVTKIAGDVVASADPGRALKVWREKLGVKQVQLARALKLSPSVLSDYESGRRPSPGVLFVKKYIEALVALDESQGRYASRLLAPEKSSAILAISEFTKPIGASAILKAVKGTLLTGDPEHTNLYGYTVVDSIKTIYALSGYDFYRIFGATTERALIFTKVGMGRSPLVAIRVSQLKPRMVVIHGPKQLDPLALELAKKEGLILALSGCANEDEIIASLKTLLS
ncbi:MAG: helix-turn-helix domain-containing protein [Thaumarchaeota archaeon]|nr:helix-turn-helix domain-containing protein [Nitrososphaerota archaeon]